MHYVYIVLVAAVALYNISMAAVVAVAAYPSFRHSSRLRRLYVHNPLHFLHLHWINLNRNYCRRCRKGYWRQWMEFYDFGMKSISM